MAIDFVEEKKGGIDFKADPKKPFISFGNKPKPGDTSRDFPMSDVGLLLPLTMAAPHMGRAAMGLLRGGGAAAVPAGSDVGSTGGIISSAPAPAGPGLMGSIKSGLSSAKSFVKPAWEVAKVLGAWEAAKGLFRQGQGLLKDDDSAPATPFVDYKKKDAEGISRKPQSIDFKEAEPESVYRKVSGIKNPTGPYSSGLAYNLAGMRGANPLTKKSGLIQDEEEMDSPEDYQDKPASELSFGPGSPFPYDAIPEEEKSYREKDLPPQVQDLLNRRRKFIDDAYNYAEKNGYDAGYEFDAYDYGKMLIEQGRGDLVPYPKTDEENEQFMEDFDDELGLNLTGEQIEEFYKGFEQDHGMFLPNGKLPNGRLRDDEVEAMKQKSMPEGLTPAQKRIWMQNEAQEKENPNWLWGPSNRQPQGMLDKPESVYKRLNGIKSPTGPYRSGLAQNLAGLRSVNPLGKKKGLLSEFKGDDENIDLPDDEDSEFKKAGFAFPYDALEPERRLYDEKDLPEKIQNIIGLRRRFYEDAKRAGAADAYEYGKAMIEDGLEDELPFPTTAEGAQDAALDIAETLEASGLTDDQIEQIMTGLDADNDLLVDNENEPSDKGYPSLKQEAQQKELDEWMKKETGARLRPGPQGLLRR